MISRSISKHRSYQIFITFQLFGLSAVLHLQRKDQSTRINTVNTITNLTLFSIELKIIILISKFLSKIFGYLLASLRPLINFMISFQVAGIDAFLRILLLRFPFFSYFYEPPIISVFAFRVEHEEKLEYASG